MNSRLIRGGAAAVFLSTLFPAHAGERVAKTATKKTKQETATTTAPARVQFATRGYKPIRTVEGRLTVERAVEIALLQNPEILRAVQEIERTRGLIIEVRAQALPQITLVGSYNQQDRRLLQGGRGGGGAGGAFGAGNLNFNQFGAANAGMGAGVGGPNPVRQPVQANASQGEGAQGGDAEAVNLEELFEELGESNNNGGGQIQNKSWRVAIEARQVIYAGGQIRAALNIARLTEDSAYFQLRDVIDRVISQVRQEFYTILLNRALITVAEEAVRLAEEQLEDQRNRFEAGTVPRFNVLRAEVELANVRPNLIRARNDYLISRFQLSRTLGLDPGPDGRPEFIAVGELTVSRRPLELDDALSLARARRAFLKVQRQTILIEAEQIKVSVAGYKPRLDARAGYEVRNQPFSTDLGDTVNGWFFGVTGSWDIFDGFETFGQVKQAKARLQAAKINYDDSVRQVELEVQTAFANLLQALETIESQRLNVEQAREALRLAQERLAAGAGTQLEVLDARVALTRAQTTELQARADYNRALAEFDRATGIDTIYDDKWQDPLAKVERGIIEKVATIGLRKPGKEPEEQTTTTVTRTRREVRVPDGKSTR